MFKIYVGNLDPRVKIEQVRELFAPFAAIEDAVIATDASTGKSKGFAIIMIRDPEIGRAAVKATQGKRLLGKTLTINEVVKKGKAAVKAAKEVRQGPFGPHFNRQSGGRTGSTVGGVRSGGLRRGMNRGPRGPGLGGGGSSFPRGIGGGGSSTSGPFGNAGGPSNLRSDLKDGMGSRHMPPDRPIDPSSDSNQPRPS
jgi:RNA recognition motif-containing protein